MVSALYPVQDQLVQGTATVSTPVTVTVAGG
jgi:hypothetical protein